MKTESNPKVNESRNSQKNTPIQVEAGKGPLVDRKKPKARYLYTL
jgi:hypothetical protein